MIKVFHHLKIRSLFLWRQQCFSRKNINGLGLELSYAEVMMTNKELVADKTILIENLLKSRSIYLITRPRRMGKTFNLSMLEAFFDEDMREFNSCFKGTYIETQNDIFREHVSQYPVISICLKG